MKVIQIPTHELKHYEFNNRTHPESQIEHIAQSIDEFGFNQPIVIDADNQIIAGHGRHLAAKKLNMKEVPCVRVEGLSEQQLRAYRIIDNKLQNDSKWAFNNLELEIGWLEDNDYDSSLYELDALIESINSQNDDPLPKEASGLGVEDYRIEIKCMSESHQKEVYEELQKQGHECRILTL